MKVIVTGATGFIGRNLAEALHQGGCEVVATGRSLAVGRELSQNGMEFRPADIRVPSQVDEAFSPADCVVHCAGRSGDWGVYQDFYDVNVVGTQNVIRACTRHRIRRLIFVSTPSVYYTGKDRHNISESEPLPCKQATHYAKTKILAEQQTNLLREEGGQTITLRPRAVYGPHDSTFIPRILRLAEKNRFPLLNGGRALADLTYVDNLVDAIIGCLSAPDSAWNEVYNISNGEPISVREWFAQMLALFDRPFRPKNVPVPIAMAMARAWELAGALPFGPKQPVLTRFSVGYMAKTMTLCIEKAKSRLGYAPRIGNQEGFRRTAAFYRAQRLPKEQAQNS